MNILKRVILITIVVIVVIIAVIILFQEYWLKSAVTKYVKDKIGGQFQIERIRLSRRPVGINVEIEKVEFKNAGANASLKNCNIGISFPKILKPKISHIFLEGVNVNLKNLEKTKEMFNSLIRKSPQPSFTKGGRRGDFYSSRRSDVTSEQEGFTRNFDKDSLEAADDELFLDLRNISFEWEPKKNNHIDILFSFRGNLQGKNAGKIDNFEIHQGNFQGENFNIKGVKFKTINVIPDNSSNYLLEVNELNIKDKKIDQLIIPLEIGDGKIHFNKIRHKLLGESGCMDVRWEFNNSLTLPFPQTGEGKSNFTLSSPHRGEDKGEGDSCLYLDLEKVSLNNLISLMTDDVIIKGAFSGEIKVCINGKENLPLFPSLLKGGQGGILIKTAKGILFNNEGGSIILRKGMPLDFLRKYMDPASYKVFVDNINNYPYNKGKIKIEKKGPDIIVTFNFESEGKGKRDITINFHTD